MDQTKLQYVLYFLVISLLVVFLSFGTIQTLENETNIKEYSGIYSREFEAVQFVECGNDESWWANALPEIDYSLKMKYISRKNTEKNLIFVKVMAVLSDAGKYGHFGMSERELTIHELKYSSNQVPEGCFEWD